MMRAAYYERQGPAASVLKVINPVMNSNRMSASSQRDGTSKIVPSKKYNTQ